MAIATGECHLTAMTWNPPGKPNVAANRIREHRRRRGLSQESLAEMLDSTATTISNLEHGKIKLTEDWMRRLSRVLDVPASDLTIDGLGAPAAPFRGAGPGRGLPQGAGAAEVQASTLPLYASTADPDAMTVTVDWSRPAEHVRRPPGLVGHDTAYCLYMHGDCMVPRFEHGERLYVSPSRPARNGDDVVVVLADLDGPRRKGDGDPARVYVRRLVQVQDKALTLAQFRPVMDIAVPAGRVAAIHRIYPTAELLGT